jgi:hypothetical protein
MYGYAHIVGARFYQKTRGLRQEFFKKCRAEILPFGPDALPAHPNRVRMSRDAECRARNASQSVAGGRMPEQ